jgi:hypothetical protein
MAVVLVSGLGLQCVTGALKPDYSRTGLKSQKGPQCARSPTVATATSEWFPPMQMMPGGWMVGQQYKCPISTGAGGSLKAMPEPGKARPGALGTCTPPPGSRAQLALAPGQTHQAPRRSRRARKFRTSLNAPEVLFHSAWAALPPAITTRAPFQGNSHCYCKRLLGLVCWQ